ncbi:receptor activity-modifying protein 1 isoform X2 [Erpetoichthys calabaricus]|uniref:receptor activity-modifying protein 1 isoform X2 n=1 Tax=Erpetoichthys calabaricus TaxID=27687 RepID=UPI00109EF2CC|nr:receptor activity-modifying protein 1 isoform X2 [Erpetoichthys calabaricus]
MCKLIISFLLLPVMKPSTCTPLKIYVWPSSKVTWRLWANGTGATGTKQSYKELTNCTYLVAEELKCYWPNQFVDEFFIGVHKFYFRNCSLSGRLPKDPPNNILGPMIVVPIIVTLLMTVLVVWRSKRSEGIV